MLLFPLYATGFFLSIIALVAWFYFRHRAGWIRRFQMLLLLGLGVYLFSVLTADAEFGTKLSVIFRDFMIVGATGFVFQFLVRKRPAFFFGLVALGIILFWFYNNYLKESFVEKEAVELDVNGELLIELRENSSLQSIEALTNQYGLRLEPAFTMEHPEQSDLDDYYLVDIPDAYADQLRQIERALRRTATVEWTEPNEVIKVDPLIPKKLPENIRKKFGIDDPGLEHLWGFEEMNVDKLYDYLKEKRIKPKRKALIAILDTGVDAKHEDLADNFKSIKSKYDDDPRGHGTHCAGIAAAVSNNGVGVASFSRGNEFVEVTSIKVLNAFGSGTQRGIINGMLEAADKGAAVISMSLGGRSNQSRQRAYEKAVAYANKTGAIVVAAAGNSNRNATDFSPVNAAGVIGVSAIDESLNRAVFSNYVTDLKMGIAAPGVNIYSTVPSDQYASYSGTSMATPYVAGMVGLLKAIQPELTTEQAFQILDITGSETRATKETGKLIQPHAAVKKLVEKKN
jgi:thermitase